MTIRRIQPLPLAKIMGIGYGIMGLLFGVFFAIAFSGFGGLSQTQKPMPGWAAAIFGVAAVIFMPILYGLMGFVGGLISALVYNLLAGRIGGIVLEVEDHAAAG